MSQIFQHERLDLNTLGERGCRIPFLGRFTRRGGLRSYFEIFSSLTEISIPLLVDVITHSLECPLFVRRVGYAEFVFIPNCTKGILVSFCSSPLIRRPILCKTIKQATPEMPKEIPLVRPFLELGELLDGLAGAGQHTENVESDLKYH